MCDPQRPSMTKLTFREDRALMTMMSCPHGFAMLGEFARGTGRVTLSALVDKGLAEVGPDRQGNPGWGITPAGRDALREGHA